MQGSLLVHDLRKVITIVDLLRDIGLDKQLSLPKVVVLGNQSSGKSSLLEQIVGLDFLPRGSGVVTRRPLQLRMNNIPELKEPYAEFDEIIEDNKKKRFTNFDQVRDSINVVTDKICGKDKAIVDIPIVLNIFSSGCPNLTIVDLPGITSIPVGNQPQNIYEVTRNMALRYIKQPRSIILCVIPANQDLSTSEALKFLQQVDPSGERSIGCLTKIDIMDRGVDAAKVLKNQEIPLRYGYVGIKNRSQQDINNKVPVSQSLKAERKYFTTSPIYSTLPPQTFSTESLTHKLTHILYTQIKSSMPDIFEEIKKKRLQAQEQLDKLGPSVATTEAEMVNYAWKSISSFMRIFKNSINGIKNVDYIEDPISSQIREELNNLYREEYEQPATEQLTDKDIEKAMINFPGDSTIPGFPSIDAFLALMNPLLKKLQAPAYTVNSRVHEIMEKQATQIVDSVMTKKFPDFNYLFQTLIKRVLQKHRKQLQTYMGFLLDSELNYLYTNDIGYLAGEFSLTDKEKKKLETGKIRDPLIFELRKRIDSYFKLVVRNLRDLVPKQIFNFLISRCIKEMEFEAFQFTSDVQKLKNCLVEPTENKNKRIECLKAIKVFEESQKRIRMDPQISKLIRNTNKESKYYKKHGMKSPQEQEEERQKQDSAKRKQAISQQNRPPTGGNPSSQGGQGGQIGQGGKSPTRPTPPSQQTQPQQTQNRTQPQMQKKPQSQQSSTSNSSSNTNTISNASQNLFGVNPITTTTGTNNTSTGQPKVQTNNPPVNQPNNINAERERRQTTNPMSGNMFGDTSKQPNGNQPQPTMTKQNATGTGTTITNTTAANKNFTDVWNEPQIKPERPQENPSDKPPAEKKRATFNNLFGLK